MKEHYKIYQLDQNFIKDIRQNIANVESILDIIQNRFLNIIEPKYKVKNYYLTKDIKHKHNFEYTHILIIGLSDYMMYDSSRIVLNLSLDNKEIKNDYNTLATTEDLKVIWDIFRKYNITCYNTSKILERREEIIANLQEKYLPLFIDNIYNGKSILFNKIDYNFINNNNNEYLIVYLDETNNIGKNVINISKSFITRCKCIPFQVLKFVGTYNDRSFEYIYTTYWFFDRDMQTTKTNGVYPNKITHLLYDFYEEIKQKNNKKYREYHLESKLIDYKSMIKNNLLDLIDYTYDDIYFDYPYLNQAVQIINNYVANNLLDFGESLVQHTQTVVNTWEENGHGMVSFRDEIYDETTKLECDVFISFGSYDTTFS